MELQYDGASRAQLREALEAYSLAPNKGLGQNFLCDQRACDAIVSAAGDLSQCHVLEIGPGPGALTVRLIQKAKRVTALELDAGMCRLLEGKIHADTFTLVHGDALKEDLAALVPCGPAAVVANLPYYVTTPILMRLLQELPCAQTMVLMMQKEVAQRLCAAPGSKTYGSLSIAVQYHAEVETVLKVSPASFFPQPDVESTVVRMRRRPYARAPKDEALFFEVMRSAFAMRRKTLCNNLAHFQKMGRERAQNAIEMAGLSPTDRGERLCIDDYISLSDAVLAVLAERP